MDFYFKSFGTFVKPCFLIFNVSTAPVSDILAIMAKYTSSKVCCKVLASCLFFVGVQNVRHSLIKFLVVIPPEKSTLNISTLLLRSSKSRARNLQSKPCKSAVAMVVLFVSDNFPLNFTKILKNVSRILFSKKIPHPCTPSVQCSSLFEVFWVFWGETNQATSSTKATSS